MGWIAVPAVDVAVVADEVVPVWVCKLLWIWFCMRGDMNMGFGVPATKVDEDVEAEGVDTTVGEVGSMVNAPNPVVFACEERVSSCARRLAVSAIRGEWTRVGRSRR